MFFHVINHFQPEGAGPHIEASTLFSASLAVRSPLVAKVLVVDGSRHENPALAAALRAFGADYHHAGRSLGFAEGYNLGLSRSDQPWTILCANDIYPSLDIFRALHDASGKGLDSTVGCVVTYLTRSDLGLQAAWDLAGAAPVDIPLMTLNINAFPTEYLRSIGGVPQEFSGAYNDVMMSYRIKQDGRRILLAPVQCMHFGSLTLDTGPSSVDFDTDCAHMPKAYPQLYQEGGIWELDIGQFANSRLLKLMAKAIWLLPVNRRAKAAERALRIGLRLARWKAARNWGNSAV